MANHPKRTVEGRVWETSPMFFHRWAGPALEEDNGNKHWYWKGEPVYTDQGSADDCFKWFLGKPDRNDRRYYIPSPDFIKKGFWARGYSKPRKSR